MTETTAAERKLAWAIEQVDRLCRETLSFEHAKAYSLRKEREDRSAEDVHYECFAIVRKAFPDDWPLMFGDAIQNLRNALDYGVYAAAGGRGKTAFPIFTDRCEFQVIGAKRVRDVPKPIRTQIENAQPFNSLSPAEDDPLAILADLSNFDKHRSLPLAAGSMTVTWLPRLEDDFPDLTFDYVIPWTEPLHEGTRVVAFTLRGPQAAKVKVKPDFAYRVGVERYKRGARRPELLGLEQTLRQIALRVTEVVAALQGRHQIVVWTREEPSGDQEFPPAKG